MWNGLLTDACQRKSRHRKYVRENEFQGPSSHETFLTFSRSMGFYTLKEPDVGRAACGTSLIEKSSVHQADGH